MGLATVEMRRAKLRFGLLTIAVALLVFLILLLTTLSNALISSLVGALKGLDTQGLVYSTSSQDNIAASRLAPETVAAVAAVPGVTAAAGVGTFTASASVAGVEGDLQAFGFTPDAPGRPTSLSAGRLPTTDTEVAIDGDAAIGDVVTLGSQSLEVVGLLRGAQFNALPTAYMTLAAYERAVTEINPGLPFVPVNAVAFTIDDGATLAEVATAVTSAVDGVKAYSLDDAVASIPGIDSISQSFGILVGLTFIIGIVVIGFFFLILTVQKMRTFTLLRAVGSSSGGLARTVALQIAVVVILASVVALILTLLALQGINTGIPVSLDAVTVGSTIGAVLVFSLLAGLLSIRRIVRIDPSAAVGNR
jgi:putative ABC transport system permease protein